MILEAKQNSTEKRSRWNSFRPELDEEILEYKLTDRKQAEEEAMLRFVQETNEALVYKLEETLDINRVTALQYADKIRIKEIEKRASGRDASLGDP